jgi:hypothetical protein
VATVLGAVFSKEAAMRKASILLLAWLVAVVLVSVPGVDDALAVPGFARQTSNTCSACHTTWPQLTDYGRQFKEAGYTAEGPKQEISDFLTWYQTTPFSGRLNMRLVDVRTSKTKTGDVTDQDKQLKLRAMHEFEFFFAGMLSENFSFFAEVEGEDEMLVASDEEDRGMDMWFAHGSVGYHYRPEFNVDFGWGSPLFADPYNTVYYRRSTPYGRAVEGFLPGTSQFLSVSGRVAEKVFYLLALHDHDFDLEGHDPYDFTGRLAFDVMAQGEGVPHVSVGGLFTNYHETPYDTLGNKLDGYNWQGFGGDLQVDYTAGQHGLHLNVVFANKEMPVGSDSTISDWCLSTEAHYLYMQEDRPLFVLTAAFEHWTESDGNDAWNSLALFATYYARENARLQVGWEGVVGAPDVYKNKESRIYTVVDLGF